MPCIRTILLKRTACCLTVREVDARADQFNGSVLQAIGINEEALIEVDSEVHLLGIVLVEHAYILVQMWLVENTVEALTRPHLTKSILGLTILVTYALIGH